jgi:hypothetical protein
MLARRGNAQSRGRLEDAKAHHKRVGDTARRRRIPGIASAPRSRPDAPPTMKDARRTRTAARAAKSPPLPWTAYVVRDGLRRRRAVYREKPWTRWPQRIAGPGATSAAAQDHLVPR